MRDDFVPVRYSKWSNQLLQRSSLQRSVEMDFAAMVREQAAMSVREEHAEVLQVADLRLLGGLDIQWLDDSQGIGALVVLSWPSLSLVYKNTIAVTTQVP